ARAVAWARAPDRGLARRGPDRLARRADAGGALPDRARGARGGDPARPAVPFRGRGHHGSAGNATPGDPRRRAHRAAPAGARGPRRAGADVGGDAYARPRGRRDDDEPRTARPADRRRLVFRAVNGDGPQQHLLFVWKPSGYELVEQDGDP